MLHNEKQEKQTYVGSFKFSSQHHKAFYNRRPDGVKIVEPLVSRGVCDGNVVGGVVGAFASKLHVILIEFVALQRVEAESERQNHHRIESQRFHECKANAFKHLCVN